MQPPEVDKPEDVASGTVMGVKHAAVRKLYHELGIPSNELPIEKFKFLTRLHYWAADTVTHGPKRYVVDTAIFSMAWRFLSAQYYLPIPF